MKNTGIIIVGAAIAAYLLFSGKGSGSEGSGGSLGIPADVIGSVGATPEIANQPSFISRLMGGKNESYTSSFPSSVSGLTSSYPVVMYDVKKGGNQLAVQSAAQPTSSFFGGGQSGGSGFGGSYASKGVSLGAATASFPSSISGVKASSSSSGGWGAVSTSKKRGKG